MESLLQIVRGGGASPVLPSGVVLPQSPTLAWSNLTLIQSIPKTTETPCVYRGGMPYLDNKINQSPGTLTLPLGQPEDSRTASPMEQLSISSLEELPIPIPCSPSE